MTKVKICGITNLDDALAAVEAGADMLGFIFYEPSLRYVRPEVVREIVAGVGGRGSGVGGQSLVMHPAPRTPHPVTFVGVFVNSPLDTVAHTLDFCGLDAVQLHGEEPPEFVNHFQGRAFKALRPQSLEEAETLIQQYQPIQKDEGGRRKDEILIEEHPSTLPIFQPFDFAQGKPSNPSTSLRASLPTLLLDAYHPNLYGGTGHVADWEMAASIARRYPIILAGSLTPENVAEAVRVVRPWGVDVSSGVEREKGKKDHEKVRALVEAVRGALS